MKLHFESDLDYQLAAIEAVCDLFRGQEICRSEFTVTTHTPSAPIADDLFPGLFPQQQLSLGVADSDLGVGNKLTLLDDEIEGNLHAIQLRGGLPPSGSLLSGDFTIEMETGTGKTYVYRKDGPVSVAKFELGESDEPEQREARTLRQRQACDVIEQLLARIG